MKLSGFRSIALLSLVLTTLSLPEIAHACVCKAESIKQRINNAKYVFVARMVNSADARDGQNLTLDHHIAVKGSPLDHIFVAHKSCPVNFKTNHYYIFYAKDSDENQYAMTDLCMGTKESSFSAEELRQLFTK